MKCDACRACPVRKNDCIGVKFETRKYFTGEGAISTGEEWRSRRVEYSCVAMAQCRRINRRGCKEGVKIAKSSRKGRKEGTKIAK